MRQSKSVWVVVLAAFFALGTWAAAPHGPATRAGLEKTARHQALAARHGEHTRARAGTKQALTRERDTHPAPGARAHEWKSAKNSAIVAAAPIALLVTNTNDDGPGSLRAAVDQANGNPGSTITFSLPYYPTTITLTTGELDLESDVTIKGPGADKLSISGDHENFIFYVGEATVTISGLTITDGYSEDDGGGVYNDGILLLKDSQILSCYSENHGGGIVNYYQLTMENCSISDNGSYDYGAGLEDYGNSVILVNCSFLENDSSDDGGGMSLDGEYCSMTNVTIADNYSDNSGGGVWGNNDEALYELRNTVIAYNEADGDGQDWHGFFYSYGHNLIDYTDDIYFIDGPATGDIYDVEAGLSYPPMPNGGPTLNEIPLPASPLIDAGDDSVLGPPLYLTTDQRGASRKIGARVDIGAIESETFMSLYDDGEQSMACVGSGGTFYWMVIGGSYEGDMFSGTLNVYNGGTMFWSQPGAPQYVYIYYDPNNHMAWGYLYDYSTGLYSSLFDTNTLDDPPVCQYFLYGGEN